MGPIYYYFMAPFLWIWNFNPVGPAIMVALFGIATTYLVFLVGKKIYGWEISIVASLLYSVSPLIVSYSRSSWNPNIIPFFAILLFYFLWDVVANNNQKRMFWIGIMLGIGLQLHYSFLSLFGVVALWFLYYKRTVSYVKQYAIGVIGFIVGFSPFLAFEVRHGFMNIRSILMFVFEGKDTGFSIQNFFSNIIDVYFRLFGRLLLRLPEKGVLGNYPFFEKTLLINGTWALALSGLGLVICICIWKKHFLKLFGIEKDRQQPFFYGIHLTLLWVLVICIFFGFYKKAIYDYYFGIMYFVPFFIVGFIFKTLFEYKSYWRYIGFVLVGLLVLYNWQGRPFVYAPNNQLGQVELISREVIKNANGQPFNFALITGGNSDHAYRYFFELWKQTPVVIDNAVIDPERKTVTDQLFIVCEDISCKPLGNSLWEVAGFGRAEIVGQWDVSVVRIYKLVHYQGT